eukprot:s252_g8.t1
MSQLGATSRFHRLAAHEGRDFTVDSPTMFDEIPGLVVRAKAAMVPSLCTLKSRIQRSKRVNTGRTSHMGVPR